MSKLLSVIVAILLLITMNGCGTRPAAPNPGNPSEKPALREFDIVLDWYPNAVHSFLYNAVEKGYFAEEGIHLNIRFPANANDAISLVAAGRAQVGMYYQQDVIMARVNQNVPIKAIAAIVQSPLNIILSLKDKSIKSPDDLVGKTIGYAGSELNEALVKGMMQHVGADYSDVTMVDVGFELMSAMTTGNVDATIGCYINHEVSQMLEEGFDVNYFTVDKYGVPTYYEGVLLASDEMIKNEPELLRAFLRACARGFADVKVDPEAALGILLKNQNEENFPLSESVER